MPDYLQVTLCEGDNEIAHANTQRGGEPIKLHIGAWEMQIWFPPNNAKAGPIAGIFPATIRDLSAEGEGLVLRLKAWEEHHAAPVA